jgi:single-strand DNA-binding protein
VADGLNRVTLFGNLGADPELRVTQSGQSVLKMRLATSASYFDKDKQQRQERVEWHSVTVWGKRAEALAKFLSKGSRLLVEGELRTSSWDDENGNKRYRTEVNALNIILAGGGSQHQRDNVRNPPSDQYSQGDDERGYEDDIPF